MSVISCSDKILDYCQKNPHGVTQDMLLKGIDDLGNMEELVLALNQLLCQGRIEIFQGVHSSDPIYKMVNTEEFSRIQGLPPEYILVYRLIQAAQREGAWLKTLKQQSKLQAVQLNKAIKVLEQKQLVKSFKSVLAKNKKFYILYHLQPAVEHQGGVGYGPDLEFDREFIDELTAQCYRMISHQGYGDLEQICEFIKKSNISRVELGKDDLQKIVDTLIYDGKVEEFTIPQETGITRKKVLYRMTRIGFPRNGITATPCGTCPIFDQCSEDGRITPSKCEYLNEWLQY